MFPDSHVGVGQGAGEPEPQLAHSAGDTPANYPRAELARAETIEAASPARVYDAWLGGKDSRAVDRRVAGEVAELVPWVPVAVRANRRFLVRAVRHLAGRGVRQFLDVGSGLPTRPNVHEVAQRVHPDARVVYVDNDPVVVAHGRALLVEDARTVVVPGDVRDPGGILADPLVAAQLDWSRPVGVLLVAVLHFVPDDAVALGAVRALRAALAPGSAVVVSHVTPGPPQQAEAMRAALAAYRQVAVPIVPRAPEAVAGFFEGMELVAPGLVRVDRWQARGERDWWPRAAWSTLAAPPGAGEVHGVAGVGLLPATGASGSGGGGG